MEAAPAAAVEPQATGSKASSRVCVAVRCRPLSEKEELAGGTSAVQTPGQARLVLKHKGENAAFNFDHVFGPEVEQRQIFETLGVPQLNQAFEGYNSTIFAYGQTGSGKTHTMLNIHAQDAEQRGLIPRISDGLFARIAERKQQHPSKHFLVECSFLEIYNEVVYDLLAPKRKDKAAGLEVKESKGVGVYVKDLTETIADTPEKLSRLIEEGLAMRAVAATKMNETSSRSHCIFTIRLRQKDENDSSQNTISKLNLVDLAGSERAKDTGAEGALLKEGANINKSLSALGNVINALSSMAETGKKRAYVPYRDSKLTRVLQESLGMNSFCTMVAAISPSGTNAEETFSTLNFAKRAKVIRVTATRNAENVQLKQLEREMEALHQKLHMDQTEEVEERHRQELEHLQSLANQSWEDKQKLSQQHEEQRRLAREEMANVADRMKRDKQRKLQLLEHRGDVHLTLQAVEATGSRQRSEWPAKVAAALKAWEQVQSQLRAVALYRDSAGADLAALWARCDAGGGDGAAAFRDEEVAPAVTHLGQVRNKFDSMAKELAELVRREALARNQLFELAPEVAVALHDARAEVATAAEAAAAGGAAGGLAIAPGGDEEELPPLIELVQAQLAAHCAREHARFEGDVHRLLFGEDLARLAGCLSKEAPGAAGAQDCMEELRAVAEALSAQAQTVPPQPPDPAADSPTSIQAAPPRLLGLATGELPDSRLAASSNAVAVSCGRLLRTGGFGGWCPVTESPEEYLELDVGQAAEVVGFSLQGRTPCTGISSQTHELLRLALSGFEQECGFLGVSEETFARPPVRLVHEVAMVLIESRKCFGEGEHQWEVDDDHATYASMSREHKVEFFQELIARTNKVFAKTGGGNGAGISCKVSADEIIKGKNCEETNRLLQMLSYLSLQRPDAAGRPGVGGLGDVAPQWVTRWRLAYLAEGSRWRWYTPEAPDGAGDAAGAFVLDGCADACAVRFVALPRSVVASCLRLHPVEWHRRPALRCEVHLADAAEASIGSLSPAAGGSQRLVGAAALAGRAASALKEALEERLRVLSRREVDFKEQAEQLRGDLERKLQEALARAEASEARASAAEADLLSARAEIEHLTAAARHAEGERAAASDALAGEEAKSAEKDEDWHKLQAALADLTEQLLVMTDERDALRSHEEELETAIASKDEELAKAHKKYVELTTRMKSQAVDEETADLLAQDLQKMSEQNNQLQNSHDASLRECTRLREEVTTLKASNESLSRERDKLLRKKDKLEAKKVELAGKLEESEKFRLRALEKAMTLAGKRGVVESEYVDDGNSVGRTSRPLSGHSSRSGRSAHGAGAAAAFALAAAAAEGNGVAAASGSPRFGGGGDVPARADGGGSPAFGAVDKNCKELASMDVE